MPENTWSVITESFDLLRAAASAISDINGADPTPCTEWTVTQVLQHAVGDQLAWAKALGVGAGPSENPFAPSGRLDGRVDAFTDPALKVATSPWAGARPGDDTVLPTQLPQGSLPAPTDRRGLCPRRRRARLGHRRGTWPSPVVDRLPGCSTSPNRPRYHRAPPPVRRLGPPAQPPPGRRHQRRAAALPRAQPELGRGPVRCGRPSAGPSSRNARNARKRGSFKLEGHPAK
jgi:hypothetical protein